MIKAQSHFLCTIQANRIPGYIRSLLQQAGSNHRKYSSPQTHHQGILNAILAELMEDFIPSFCLFVIGAKEYSRLYCGYIAVIHGGIVDHYRFP